MKIEKIIRFDNFTRHPAQLQTVPALVGEIRITDLNN